MPVLPLLLWSDRQSAPVSGLLDTGAAINVLPYSVGIQLGAIWEKEKTPVRLTGNMAGVEARVLVVTARVGSFDRVRLAFAWANSDTMLASLGQTNFFQEFDVCFFRARSIFEIRPKS